MPVARTDNRPVLEARLASGRGVWCLKYVVANTYGDFLERTPSENANSHMIDGVRSEAKRVFGDWPVHVLTPARDPGAIDYPGVRFTGFFTSLPMREEMHLSSLVLVWFRDQQSPALNDASLQALQAIEWERLAVDYEI
jgi:hypothetical protein